MIIQHNMEAANAQRQYKINVGEKSRTVEKLSSGYRINRAADDAAGLTISEEMRSQIRGLEKACRNVQDGSSLVQTADGALNEIHSINQRQRELLVQAANDTNTDADRESIDMEIWMLNEEKDRIYNDTEFNTIKIFKGKDQIIDGPKTTTVTNETWPINDTSTSVKKDVIWVEKNTTPPQDVHTQTQRVVPGQFSSTYTETEELNKKMPDGHDIFDEKSIYTTTGYTDIYTDTLDIKYQKQGTDSKYTNLQKPKDMVGGNGYINVYNEAGNLSLSCAMSQLGVKLDDDLVGYSMYYDSKITKSTTSSPDGNVAETTFQLGKNVTLVQKIELIKNGDEQSYNISYALNNGDAQPHKLDVRLAFDTMNTPIKSVKNKNPYKLENDDAEIEINGDNKGTGTFKTVLGAIDDLYDTWDDSKVIENVSGIVHTGTGFWWEDNTIPAGNKIDLGSVTYGPIKLKKDPYEVTTTTDSQRQRKQTETITTETSTIQPEYLDIQAGANAWQNIPIRLYDLSTVKLKENVGDTDPVSAFHAADSLKHLDRVIDKISSIRSYYGAMQNRLGSAYNNNANYSENISASESRIRDTDMENELVTNSKYNILQQAGEALIAQANQNKQGVLELLQ
ncbi:MAG: flagellin [Lachnospiraceae bacterium]|nr:flagellin [uncultured Agathobacter sp.]MDD6138336.1 flagellin [Lachnospiraceae bacterium]